MENYVANPIVIGKNGPNAKPGFAVRCPPSPDGRKTRAARLLGDGLKAPNSRRRGYTATASKFARFEKLYAEGWDACVMTGVLIPPETKES